MEHKKVNNEIVSDEILNDAIVEIYDSTLRDGAQGEGISFTTLDKLAIMQRLDEFGVSYIEGGNPASNPRDMEFFEQAVAYELKNSTLVAFGSTRRRDKTVEEDSSIKALLHANTKAICIFGKASEFHIKEILHATTQENLQMISDTVKYLVGCGKTVFFDAEHFFDGYRENQGVALECLKTAKEAGAQRLILCDTNGGSLPHDILKIVGEVKAIFHDIPIGIHCHDDNGCGVANSIMAVLAGATQVQGTYLGFGERCGNANLSAIIPTLQLKMGYSCIPQNSMKSLTITARFIADVTNLGIANSLPYVGKSAFAHKGGMHVDGVTKNPNSFEHVSPEQVGNRRNVLLSDVAGRSALISMLREIDPTITKDSPKAHETVELLKELEREGYVFELATASLTLRLRKKLNCFSPFFKLHRFTVIGEQSSNDEPNISTAMIKLVVNGKEEISAAEGDGPVHALDIALKKAVERFYPSVKTMRLTDYKVRVIEPSDATAAMVRVLITSSDGEDIWTTVGVSRDIIEARLIALTDAVEYKLLHEYAKRK